MKPEDESNIVKLPIPPLDDEDLADAHRERKGNSAGMDEDDIEQLKSELLSIIETCDEEQIFSIGTLTKGVTIKRVDFGFYVGALARKLKTLRIWGDWKAAVENLAKTMEVSTAGIQVKISLTQVVQALRKNSGGWCFAYDRFLELVMVWPNGEVDGRPLQDEDVTWVRLHLEGAIGEAGAKDVQAAINAVAMENAFDSAINWIGSLPEWDGVERVSGYYIDTFGVADTPYTRAVGRYRWTAAAGRIMEPGIQADMAPVLVGAQGIRKTSAIQATCPNLEWYTSLDLNTKGVEIIRQIRGKVNVELEELAGLKYAEMEWVKAFVSKRYDDDRPPFTRNYVKFYRRCIFEGTANKREILRDTTGNRRWLPMEVPPGTEKADIEALREIRDQLWAEGLHLFRKNGVMYQEAEELAEAEHGDFMPHDPDIDIVEALFDMAIRTEIAEKDQKPRTYRQRGWITFAEAAEHGFDLPKNQHQKYATKITSALTRAGCVKEGRRGGRKDRVSRWNIP